MKKLFVVILSLFMLTVFSFSAFAASSVTFSKHTIFFYVFNGKLGFQETYYYNNPNGENIKISLPKGATEITYGSAGGSGTLKETDLKETTANLEAEIKVPKGSDTIEVRYFVKPVGNGFDYSSTLNYPTEKIELLSTGDVVPFGHQLGQLPREKSANGFYVVPVNPVKPGEVLQLRLMADPSALSGEKDNQAAAPANQNAQAEGQTGSAAARSTSTNLLAAVLAVVLIILIAAAVYYFIKMRKQ